MIVEELKDDVEYQRIHEAVFKKTPVDIPATILIGRNDDGQIVAFVAGAWLKTDHFQIRYSGVLPEYREGGYVRYLAFVLGNDISYDLAIENTNITAHKIALSVGFVPMGVLLQDNTLYIQYKREKHGHSG